jgi:hypothetical protein
MLSRQASWYCAPLRRPPSTERLRRITAYTLRPLAPGRASPVPVSTVPPHPAPSTPEGPSALHLQELHAFRGLRRESPGSAPSGPLAGLASRGGRIHVMLRAERLLPQIGLLTLRFGTQRFPCAPGVCYRVSWHLPGPDSHRLANTDLHRITASCSSPPLSVPCSLGTPMVH